MQFNISHHSERFEEIISQMKAKLPSFRWYNRELASKPVLPAVFYQFFYENQRSLSSLQNSSDKVYESHAHEIEMKLQMVCELQTNENLEQNNNIIIKNIISPFHYFQALQNFLISPSLTFQYKDIIYRGCDDAFSSLDEENDKKIMNLYNSFYFQIESKSERTRIPWESVTFDKIEGK